MTTKRNIRKRLSELEDDERSASGDTTAVELPADVAREIEVGEITDEEAAAIRRADLGEDLVER